MQIKFLGAAKTVTGSKYLVQAQGKTILIDCGLFQGLKELRLRNWDALPFDASKIDAVLLTHAHIDHSGYLPCLLKQGFRGKIYASSATIDLCEILLPDSGFLQELAADRANKYHYSKHHPALPLYTRAEAENSIHHFVSCEFAKEYALGDDLSFSLHRAGHILGSAFIKLKTANCSITFSGDLGRPHDQLMHAPVKLIDTDYLVLESTYGDREHDSCLPEDKIAELVQATVARGGNLLLPSFAVGRAQSLLLYLYNLKQAKLIPDVPIYVDSPMATNVTRLLFTHVNEHSLSKDKCADVCKVAEYVNSVEASKAVAASKGSKIVISASGMATGGRVLHYLRAWLPNSNNTVLFTGFQAKGTRGEKLLAGAKLIKMLGAEVEVKAQIAELTNTSAHADSVEILAWLKSLTKAPKKVFVTHGEAASAQSLQAKIQEEFGWDVCVPDYLDEFEC